MASNTVLLTGSKITASLNMILLFVLLSYFFTTEAYGSFRQVWMLSKALCMEIFSLGIPISIFYFLPKLENYDKKVFIIQTILLLLFLGIGATALIYLTADKIASWFGNKHLADYLRIFSLYPTFFLPTLALEGIAISLNRSRLFSIFTIADRLCLLIIAGITIIFYKSVETLCAVFVIFSCFEFLSVSLLTHRIMKGYEYRPRNFEFRKQLFFSIPLGLSNIINICNIEIDKIIISTFFSVGQFAKYVNGAFEIPMIGIVASSVNSIMMPEYVKLNQKSDYQGILNLWHQTICKVALFFFPVVAFLFFLSHDVITLLFSNKYEDSVLIFQIYLVAMLPKITWYSSVLISMGHSKVPLYGSSIALIGNVVLNCLFIPLFGFPGPAIATVVITYLLAIFYLHRIKAVTHASFATVFPWISLAKIILLSVFIGFLIIPLLSSGFESRIIKILVTGIAYIVSLFYMFYRLKFIDKDDLEFTRRSFANIAMMIKK